MRTSIHHPFQSAGPSKAAVHWPGLSDAGPGHFPVSLARGGFVSPAENRRRGRAVILPTSCLVATPVPSCLGKAAKARRIESCFPEPIPNPAHVRVLSSVAVNDRDRDRTEGQKIGKVFQQYE